MKTHLALAGGQPEGGHALDAIDQRVEVVGTQVEKVHRERAGLDIDSADLLRLRAACRAQLACPAAASASTAARPSGPASGARSRASRRDPFGTERVERPVLEKDVDRPAERRRAGGQDRGCLQLVVGAGEE